MATGSKSFGYNGNGLVRPNLRMGIVVFVSSSHVQVNLGHAGDPTGSHYQGGRYGRGEVGEFVLIEAQTSLLLGRVTEVKIPDNERKAISQDFVQMQSLDAIGVIQLLGSVALDTTRVTAGIEDYPRIGDRVYSAPHDFISSVPSLTESSFGDHPIRLVIGSVASSSDCMVDFSPEKLFGRHCAILGSTGGGKSWTTARIV